MHYKSVHFFLSLLLSVLLFFILPFQLEAQNEQPYRNLQHALFSAGQLTGDRGPQNVTWIDGGERYSYMQYNQRTGTTEIRLNTPATDEDKSIFNNVDYTFPGSDEQFEYNSFQWSNDYRHLVFQTNFQPVYRYSGTSDYYLYSIENDSMELIAENAFTAELSPDGEKVAYHREGELYVYKLNSNEETQLTFDAKENLFNGRFGWVYEEEFGKIQAWKWSSDSRYIAYWQSDERDVERFVSTDYEGDYPEYTDIPYPKVGSDNPSVKIGVVNIDSRKNQWLDLDIGDGLIPRMYWTNNTGELAVVHTNRQQNHLKLFFSNVENGASRLIMEEKSEKGWIDVYDFFAGIDDFFFFPDGRNEFFWISDRDGFKHLYRYNYDGEVINQVTNGNWQVTNIFSIDTKSDRIYYESTEQSPLERHLYSISFDGSNKVKHSQIKGRHSFSMSPDGKYFIDTYSNVETPTQIELHTTDNGGEMLKKIVDNQTVKDFISQFAYSPRELFSFTTTDGQELDGYIIKPPDFDEEKKYPLLLSIYGGPGSQGVYNEFETESWPQFLAQQGFIVANVNNRGNGGYGKDFEKSVYKNLGEMEAFDFAETAKYLGSKDWIDKDRIAIRGHSYGGYMASLAMVLYPDVFKVGIAGAPVSNWRLYDTIYSERYMDLLENNEEGYEKGSVMHYANKLKGKLLIVHSSLDENVHIQNTMQMITAFTNAGKDVDLRIYPLGEHGVAYNQQSYLLLYKVYTEYLNRHLK